MKKLTDLSNEESIDMLADLLDPCQEIFTDMDLKNLVSGGESQMKIIQYALKNHKEAIIQILAILDGVPVEDYHCNVLTLPMRLIELLNDKDLAPFFQS